MAHEMTSALGSQERRRKLHLKLERLWEPDQAGLCMHFKAFGLFLRAMQLKGGGGDTIRFVIFKCQAALQRRENEQMGGGYRCRSYSTSR